MTARPADPAGLPGFRSRGAGARWAARTDGPLLALSALFLVALLVPLYRPDLPSDARVLLTVVDIAVWIAFAVDYVVRLGLAEHRVKCRV